MAFDTITPTQLAQGAITTGTDTQYTTPASTRAIVTTIDICNTTAGALTVRLYLGAGATTANAIFYDTNIPANSTLAWRGSHILNATETIKTTGSAAGLTITASGGEAV